MGTIIPPPAGPPPPQPPGLACVNCWGPGKPFGDGDTPEVIFVSISGVEKGPTWDPGDGEPVNGDFIVPQFMVGCAYVLFDPDFRVQVLYDVGDTNIGVINEMGKNGFTAHVATPCVTVADNENLGDFVNGSMVITIPETT